MTGAVVAKQQHFETDCVFFYEDSDQQMDRVNRS